MKTLTLTVGLALVAAIPLGAEEITPEQMLEMERKLAEEGVQHPAIARQHEFGEIVGRVKAKHPNIYIGAEVGEFYTIYLKGETPEEVREWVKASDLDIRIVDKLPFSVKELHDKREEASAILKKAGYSVQGSSVDAPHDIWIQVGIREGQSSDEKEMFKLLPKGIATMVEIETIGGKNDPPGMTGYVVEIGSDGNSFLLAKYEPKEGRLPCNSATWFADKACRLKPGQEVEVWFSYLKESYPMQSSAIRTKVVEQEAGEAAAIRLAMEKRKEDVLPDIPYLVSIEHDNAAKQWKVLFASDANGGKVDAKAIVIKDAELSALAK